jgi:hypothetical protein
MVINLRSAVGMAAIWIVAVAGVSATAWVAIDRAGRDLTNASLTTLPAVPLIIPTLGGAQATAASPQPSPTPSPAAVPAPVTTGRQGTPTAVPTPAAVPKPIRTQPAAPAPTAQDGSINVNGGLVSVACTGATIALRIAQPDNDWRVHVDTSGEGQIVVTFQNGEEDPATKTQVSAVCTNGTPGFTTANG